MADEPQQVREMAYSIESKAEELKAAVIGKEQIGSRIYVYYQDGNGAYWYENRFWNGKEEVSEEEHIFGRKIRRRR